MRLEPAATVAAILATSLIVAACGSRGEVPEGPMDEILSSHPGLRQVLRSPADYRFQAVLGLVEDGPDGPRLVQHGYRLDAEYFYPASAIKLFAAVAALERLAELREETGLPLDADTPLVLHPLFEGEVLETTDETEVERGAITVRHEIRKLFLVSDNRAFNRLYELVGQDRLAASIARAGLRGGQIVHRLEERRSEEENRRYRRIDFLQDGELLYTLPERTSDPLPPLPEIPGIRVGRAYISNGEKINQPMDFTPKNRFPLAELQRGLCRVVRPDVDCGGPGFNLTDADRALLLEAMSQYPRESTNPVYDPTDYPDAYAKYFLPGLERVLPKNRLRIYNKVGQAYGFTTENAWIADHETGRSFFLAATLYTNANAILNDDNYEYDTVALPATADLGEAAPRWFRPEAQPGLKP